MKQQSKVVTQSINVYGIPYSEKKGWFTDEKIFE